MQRDFLSCRAPPRACCLFICHFTGLVKILLSYMEWFFFFFTEVTKPSFPNPKQPLLGDVQGALALQWFRRRVQYYAISIIFLIPPCSFSKLFWLCGYSHFHVNFGLSFPTRKSAGFVQSCFQSVNQFGKNLLAAVEWAREHFLTLHLFISSLISCSRDL